MNEKEKEEIDEEIRRHEDHISTLLGQTDKEIFKTLDWIVSVMEGDNNKSTLLEKLAEATAIIDHLNNLKMTLKRVYQMNPHERGVIGCLKEQDNERKRKN